MATILLVRLLTQMAAQLTVAPPQDTTQLLHTVHYFSVYESHGLLLHAKLDVGMIPPHNDTSTTAQLLLTHCTLRVCTPAPHDALHSPNVFVKYAYDEPEHTDRKHDVDTDGFTFADTRLASGALVPVC